MSASLSPSRCASLRPDRARDTGQLPHASVACSSEFRRSCSCRDRGSSWLTVALWFVITSTDSLDGFLAVARRRNPLGRVPRSGRRQGAGARRVRGARAARRHRVVARRRDRGPRAVRVRVPHARRPARHLVAGATARQVQGVLPVPRDRRGAPAVDRATTSVSSRPCSYLVVALTVVSAADIVHHGWRDWQRDQLPIA